MDAGRAGQRNLTANSALDGYPGMVSRWRAMALDGQGRQRRGLRNELGRYQPVNLTGSPGNDSHPAGLRTADPSPSTPNATESWKWP